MHYRNPADRSHALIVQTEAKKDAEIKKFLRMFRYAHIGAGAQTSKTAIGGMTSRSTNYGRTLEFCIDGRGTPLTVELPVRSYGGGSGTTFGETFMMVFGVLPITAAGRWPRSALYRKNAVNQEDGHGKSYEQAAREDLGEFTRSCEQFSSVRVGI